MKEKDTEQLHICLGYPGFAYGTDDVYAVAVMNNVLGGAMSSRLFQRIREELGMAYSIYTYPNSYQASAHTAFTPASARKTAIRCWRKSTANSSVS